MILGTSNGSQLRWLAEHPEVWDEYGAGKPLAPRPGEEPDCRGAAPDKVQQMLVAIRRVIFGNDR